MPVPTIGMPRGRRAKMWNPMPDRPRGLEVRRRRMSWGCMMAVDAVAVVVDTVAAVVVVGVVAVVIDRTVVVDMVVAVVAQHTVGSMAVAYVAVAVVASVVAGGSMEGLWQVCHHMVVVASVAVVAVVEVAAVEMEVDSTCWVTKKR
mgnify:CR=1 FL=1